MPFYLNWQLSCTKGRHKMFHVQPAFIRVIYYPEILPWMVVYQHDGTGERACRGHGRGTGSFAKSISKQVDSNTFAPLFASPTSSHLETKENSRDKATGGNKMHWRCCVGSWLFCRWTEASVRLTGDVPQGLLVNHWLQIDPDWVQRKAINVISKYHESSGSSSIA